MIREATAEDAPQMIELSAMKRAEYEAYSPTFWRVAADAAEKQAPFFLTQLGRENAICLVSEHEGRIDGFLIAVRVAAPPVYDPGGPVCRVDDFTVSSPDRWATTGRDLIQEVRRRAHSAGSSLTVAVCGHLDEPKREMLRSAGFSIESEWWVNPEIARASGLGSDGKA